MNIFVTDLNPFIAAKNLCDVHVIKMILETCQLLSTQDRLNGLSGDRYKSTHINHPCRKCLDNEYNYIWLQYHLYGLCQEYTYRYGKIHKSQSLLEKYWLRNDANDLYNNKLDFVENYSELLDLTTFPCCATGNFEKTSTDIFYVINFYRSYYKLKKNKLYRFTYKNRNKPIGYHQMKTNMCNKFGYQLIHVWENDWKSQKNSIKSQLKSYFTINK